MRVYLWLLFFFWGYCEIALVDFDGEGIVFVAIVPGHTAETWTWTGIKVSVALLRWNQQLHKFQFSFELRSFKYSSDIRCRTIFDRTKKKKTRNTQWQQWAKNVNIKRNFFPKKAYLVCVQVDYNTQKIVEACKMKEDKPKCKWNLFSIKSNNSTCLNIIIRWSHIRLDYKQRNGVKRIRCVVWIESRIRWWLLCESPVVIKYRCKKVSKIDIIIESVYSSFKCLTHKDPSRICDEQVFRYFIFIWPKREWTRQSEYIERGCDRSSNQWYERLLTLARYISDGC